MKFSDDTAVDPVHELQTAACPECGAPNVDGLACDDMLGMLLVWEYQDPELLAEHFLTVASFNLQHPARFTDEAITGLRASLADRLDNDISIAEIRRRATAAFDGPKRILKPQADRHFTLRNWKMTIADIYLPDHSEGAADRVRAWAASVRKEM